MRHRLSSLILALAALLLVPAAAPAAVTYGIAENRAEVFSQPLFAPLKVRHARVIAPYDVMRKGGETLSNLTNYLETARALNITPLVSFQHPRGDATICRKRSNLRREICRLPSDRQYRAAVKAFFARFPYVKTFSPWNEINHFTQPTSRNPAAAARFTNIAAKECGRGCRIVAMDVLDQANDPKARRPSYSKTIAYIQKVRRALKVKRRYCGLHNYSDINRFRDTGTKALIRAMGCTEVWGTESAALYKFGSFWSRSTRKGCSTAARCQLKAAKYMFTLLRRNPRIKRLYIYSYLGAGTGFDAALVDAEGRPRPAYTYIKGRIAR
jgi:hypothetical protein